MLIWVCMMYVSLSSFQKLTIPLTFTDQRAIVGLYICISNWNNSNYLIFSFLAIEGFAVSPERSQVVDFTHTILETSFNIVIKNPVGNPNYMAYILPFTYISWICVTYSILCRLNTRLQAVCTFHAWNAKRHNQHAQMMCQLIIKTDFQISLLKLILFLIFITKM